MEAATDATADVVDYAMHGDDMQLVEIELDSGEGVRAEAGAMVYMSDGVEMQTDTGGGVFSGFKRMFTGESFFITSFIHTGSAGKGHVGFAAPYLGKIIALDLDELGGSFLCQKDAFLCAAQGVEIETAFTKRMGAGFFGGEGFVLQRLLGAGRAFAHVGGSVVKRELGEGETLRVDTGCLAAFAPSVDYDVHRRIHEQPLRRGGLAPGAPHGAARGVPAKPALFAPGRPHRLRHQAQRGCADGLRRGIRKKAQRCPRSLAFSPVR